MPVTSYLKDLSNASCLAFFIVNKFGEAIQNQGLVAYPESGREDFGGGFEGACQGKHFQ